ALPVARPWQRRRERPHARVPRAARAGRWRTPHRRGRRGRSDRAPRGARRRLRLRAGERAGRRRRLRRLVRGTMKRLSTAVALVLALSACSTGNGTPRKSPIPESRRAELVGSLVTNVLLPSLDDLVSSAEAFEVAASAYAADVGSAEARAAVESAFRTLLEALQRVEVMQLGPLGDPAKFAGGKGLRYGLYSWPLHSRCSVDMALVDEAY